MQNYCKTESVIVKGNHGLIWEQRDQELKTGEEQSGAPPLSMKAASALTLDRSHQPPLSYHFLERP